MKEGDIVIRETTYRRLVEGDMSEITYRSALGGIALKNHSGIIDRGYTYSDTKFRLATEKEKAAFYKGCTNINEISKFKSEDSYSIF